MWEEAALCPAPAALSLNITVSAELNSQGTGPPNACVFRETSSLNDFNKFKHFLDKFAMWAKVFEIFLSMNSK